MFKNLTSARNSDIGPKTREISVVLDNVERELSLSWLCTFCWDVLRYKSHRFRLYAAVINFIGVIACVFYGNELTIISNHYRYTIPLDQGNDERKSVNFTIYEDTYFGWDGCRSSHNITQSPADMQYPPYLNVTIFYCGDYCRRYWSPHCGQWETNTQAWTKGTNTQGKLNFNLLQLKNCSRDFFFLIVAALCFCGAGILLVIFGKHTIKLGASGFVRVDVLFFFVTIGLQSYACLTWSIVGDALIDPDSPILWHRADMTFVIINDIFNTAGSKTGMTIWWLLIVGVVMLFSVLLSHLSEMYYKDYLTNLWTKAMLDVSSRMLIQSHRLPWWRRKRKLVLFSLDIDKFKDFNNVFQDHAIGDRALQIVAESLTKVSSEYKRVRAYRRGGDEFVVMGYFANTTMAIECGMELIRRARTKVVEKDGDKKSMDITISVGMAPYKEGDSKQEWDELAEQMLYFAKGSTKKLEEIDKNISQAVLDKIQTNSRDRLVYLDRDRRKYYVRADRKLGEEVTDVKTEEKVDEVQLTSHESGMNEYKLFSYKSKTNVFSDHSKDVGLTRTSLDNAITSPKQDFPPTSLEDHRTLDDNCIIVETYTSPPILKGNAWDDIELNKSDSTR